MDTETIQQNVNALIPMMLAKGLREPEAQYIIRAEGAPRIQITWITDGAVNTWDRTFKFAPTFDADRQLIAALDDKSQRTLRAFMEKLGDVIDLGKSEGIGVSFVNPLVETMKRLSENIITHQAAE